MSNSIYLPTEQATAELGAKLAGSISAGDVICLSGPLGAGKTALARSIIKYLTGFSEAPSPSFGLVETYETSHFQIWHFDLYRLQNADEIWELGFEEALAEGVLLIEWPEIIQTLLPHDALHIQLSMERNGRRATFSGDDQWIEQLQGIDHE